jgi:hypothetical protein
MSPSKAPGVERSEISARGVLRHLRVRALQNVLSAF